MRNILLSLLFVSVGAMADDLSDANRFLAAKDYGKALPLYTKLAQAGNTDAQFRLGEMLWFGDGTAQDLEAARRWFDKAAASGNGDARASLAALDRRKTRGADIDFWTRSYDGADLVSGNYACQAPAIPAVSKTNEELNATRKSIESWQGCYDGFVRHFNATVSSGKHIPEDVLDMMTPQEAERAVAHVQTVYTRVLARAQADADGLQSQQLAWEKATEGFVKEENTRIARVNEEVARLRLDIQRREQLQQAMQDRRGGVPSAPASAPTPPRGPGR